MNSNLYQPSLKDEEDGLKSYNISRIFYAAFFGGIVPAMVLCKQNAEMLKLKKQIINIMLIIGIAVFIAKLAIVGLYYYQILMISGKAIRYIFKAAALIYYFAYSQIMRVKYNQFNITGGSYTPLLGPAVLWCIAGTIAEYLLSYCLISLMAVFK